METEDSETETNNELTKMETVSFEENRIDTQLMDLKTEEQRLSDQNNRNILAKQKKIQEDEIARQIELQRVKEMSILKEGV